MTAQELASELDIPVQSVYWYTKIGVLPPPNGRTRAARYGIQHIRAFRAFREHVPARGNRFTTASFAELRLSGGV